MSTVNDILRSVDRQVNQPYRTANTVNKAGGKAWKQSEAERLDQLAMTGTLGNSFYVSTEQYVKDAIGVLENANPKILAKAIVKGRNKGFVRMFNILGLVYLSKSNTRLFKEVFNDVIRTGNDLEDFINMCHKVRGFGKAIKSALHKWINTKSTPYYALKYRRQIADAIRISRFRCQKSIFKYILAHYKSDVDTKQALREHIQLNAYDQVKDCLNDGNYDRVCALISEYRLDVQSVVGCGKLNSQVWDALGQVMPVMQFVKMIDKLDREGVFSRNPNLYKDKICVGALKRAKVFPFRLYTAYMNISNVQVKNHLADVLDAYTRDYDWSIFNKAGSWVIAPDVSGSMQGNRYRLMQGSTRQNAMTPALIAGLFTGFFYKGLDNASVVPWDTQVRPYNRPKADSVLTHIDTIKRSNGGGTRMEVSVDYLISNRIKVDNVLFITDAMEWGDGWLNAWIKYKRSNPKARAFLLRVDAYPTRPFSDDIAAKYDIRQVYGWSDNVVKYMEFCLS